MVSEEEEFTTERERERESLQVRLNSETILPSLETVSFHLIIFGNELIKSTLDSYPRREAKR